MKYWNEDKEIFLSSENTHLNVTMKDYGIDFLAIQVILNTEGQVLLSC